MWKTAVCYLLPGYRLYNISLHYMNPEATDLDLNSHFTPHKIETEDCTLPIMLQ